MEIALVLAAVLIPLLLNARATQLIVRDDLSERKQKVTQLLVVWLIPIIGAIIVLAVHRRADPPSRKYWKEPELDGEFPPGQMTRGIKEVLDGDD
jgi:hypothetical protein